MKRNIITTIKFGTGKINISAMEKLSTNLVEIFNMSDDTKNAKEFISTSLKKIEVVIGGKISKVGVVIDSNEAIDSKIKIHQEVISITGEVVTKQDIDNAIALTKKAYDTSESRVILVQPIKFDIKDLVTKSYSKAPLHKKGNTLIVVSTVTTIAEKVYAYINNLMKSFGLEISQILLASQVITQNNITKPALFSGSVLINVGYDKSFITINKNLSTIATMSIYDFGFKSLINGVEKIFGCSEKEAINMLTVHASFENKQDNNDIIYNGYSGLDSTPHYKSKLNKIIEVFTRKLIAVAQKYIDQKKVEQLPVIFSGLITGFEGLEDFVKQHMSSQYISKYSALSFAETTETNIACVGFSKFMTRLDGVLGKEFNTIVDTNPNTISWLQDKKSKKTNWLVKLTQKLGGKHEWN